MTKFKKDLLKGQKAKLVFEMRALQMLCHPYIVQIRQSWNSKNGQLHNVYDYCVGRDLNAWQKKRQQDGNGEKEHIQLPAKHCLRLFT